MTLEEMKSVAQIALPLLVAIVIPYFRKINAQLQELNKQMALSGASLEYLMREVERMRDRQHKTDNAVQKVSLIQERCSHCNGD
jgi:uncharacterized protein YoxC